MWSYPTNPSLLSTPVTHTLPPVRSALHLSRSHSAFPHYCSAMLTWWITHRPITWELDKGPAHGMMNNLGNRFPNLVSPSTRGKTSLTNRKVWYKYGYRKFGAVQASSFPEKKSNFKSGNGLVYRRWTEMKDLREPF